MGLAAVERLLAKEFFRFGFHEQRDLTYRFARGTCDRGEACWRLMERQWVDMRVPWEMGVDGS